ncbi:MAG TPA: TetR/AcrR family transcriptional regulator [Candidatus Mediterraneibacter faecavium]|uniref:TetR/AcrR family transcriptional regulator n=1 Tax=Candidatus Mediterraneibacter faecavium TaxID=2838668 RepID=A0A9D2Q922_9FIRM|nr:TetR/AcrR family transcriptional regulator [Candidatus Mediterraneibacter faecavium]
MDLRIKKTEQAIKNAFIELRAKKPLEKITVKELCSIALINKSTFYSHYEDIYALSEAMEQETVASIIRSIGHLEDYTPEKSDIYTRELCLAFMSQISLIRILFSGREQSHLGHRLDTALKELIFRKYPEYRDDMSKQILLSYSIQGAYHAYLNNPDADTDTFVRTVENIVKRLSPLL